MTTLETKNKLLQEKTTQEHCNKISKPSLKIKLTNEYIQKQTEKFAVTEGRRLRIMVASIENTHNKAKTNQLATKLADLGFDVDIEPLNRAPETIAKNAIDNDVHFICLLSTLANYKNIVVSLKKELIRFDAEDILIAIGNELGLKEIKELKLLGVSVFFRNEHYLQFSLDLLKALDSYYKE